MRIMTFALVGVLLFLVAMVVLQIFLSRRENKWAGRILPIITFGYSLVMMLNVAHTGDLWQTAGAADQCVCCGQYSNGSAAGDLLCLPRCAAAAKGIEQNECAGSGISGTAEKSRLT